MIQRLWLLKEVFGCWLLPTSMRIPVILARYCGPKRIRVFDYGREWNRSDKWGALDLHNTEQWRWFVCVVDA